MWEIKNEFMAIWASMGSEMLGLSVYKTFKKMDIKMSKNKINNIFVVKLLS